MAQSSQIFCQRIYVSSIFYLPLEFTCLSTFHLGLEELLTLLIQEADEEDSDGDEDEEEEEVDRMKPYDDALFHSLNT